MPTPSSSSVPPEPCGASAPCWGASSATSPARSSELAEVFALPLSRARRVKDQRQRQRGRKLYSLHAPEVECIGKGKAHKPYEFGVKVSVATPLNGCRGGQFVAHVKALPGNPYDGHTLAAVLPDIENTIGAGLADRHRCRVQGPQRTEAPALQGLPGRSEARAHGRHQTRVPQALSRRAHDRSPQKRAPDGAQPPGRASWRCSQRRARRRGLQLRPPPQVARSLAAHRAGRPRSAEPLEPDHRSVVITATSRATKARSVHRRPPILGDRSWRRNAATVNSLVSIHAHPSGCLRALLRQGGFARVSVDAVAEKCAKARVPPARSRSCSKAASPSC